MIVSRNQTEKHQGTNLFKTAIISSLTSKGEHFWRELVARYHLLSEWHVEKGCGSGYQTKLSFSSAFARKSLCWIWDVELLKQGKKHVRIHYFCSFDSVCNGQKPQTDRALFNVFYRIIVFNSFVCLFLSNETQQLRQNEVSVDN